jgi:hypothetical protein
MKATITAFSAALLVCHLAASAGASPADKGGQKQKKAQHASAVPRADGVDVHIVFSTRDVQIIREYYAPRYRRLPPGLQKKYARTGTLPPGWQKKMEPFPVVLERQLVVLPRGYQRGVIDGHAVIYDRGSQFIFDVAVLF